MSKTQVKAGGISLSDTFAFTGTVTGAGTLVKTGSLQSTTNGGEYNIDSVFSNTYMSSSKSFIN